MSPSDWPAAFEATMQSLLSSYGERYSYIDTYVRTGGKFIRPTLFLEACACYDVALTQAHMDIASGIELLHAFFLIHDDLMDGDELRRDKPTLHAHFRSLLGCERLGNAQGIVWGDVLHAEALRLISEGLQQLGSGDALSEVFRIVLLTAEGQVKEMDTDHFPTKQELLDFYEKKTAAYSIWLPLFLAASVSTKEVSMEDLRSACKHLGIAYQLYDDHIEITGSKQRREDGRVSDILRVKPTPHLLTAMEQLSASSREEIRGCFAHGQDLPESLYEATMEACLQKDVVRDMLSAIHEHVELARTFIDNAGLSTHAPLQRLLTTFAQAS